MNVDPMRERGRYDQYYEMLDANRENAAYGRLGNLMPFVPCAGEENFVTAEVGAVDLESAVGWGYEGYGA